MRAYQMRKTQQKRDFQRNFKDKIHKMVKTNQQSVFERSRDLLSPGEPVSDGSLDSLDADVSRITTPKGFLSPIRSPHLASLHDLNEDDI